MEDVNDSTQDAALARRSARRNSNGPPPRERPVACSPSSGPSTCSKCWPTPARARPVRTLHRLRAPPAHRAPADAHLGQPGLRPAGGVPAVHAGLAADPARRDLQPDAWHLAAPVPGPAGPPHRRDGQPGHARRRRGRLHRPGAQPALDADVHRTGPPSPAALHRGGQGPAGRASARRGAGAARAGRHARLHARHDHRPRPADRPPRGDPQAGIRRRRGRAGDRRPLLRGGRAGRAGFAGHLHLRPADPDDRRRRRPHRARAPARRPRDLRDHRGRGASGPQP